MGVKPQVHVKFLPDSILATADRLRDLDQTRKQVQKVLKAQQQHKQSRRLMEMKVGDLVWLKARNLAVRGMCKLLPKRYGPYPIVERKGAVAYQLKLPQTMKIHDVFHVDLLLPYKETEAYGPGYMRPTPDLIKGE